jgi:hypothetical protein
MGTVGTVIVKQCRNLWGRSCEKSLQKDVSDYIMRVD